MRYQREGEAAVILVETIEFICFMWYEVTIAKNIKRMLLKSAIWIKLISEHKIRIIFIMNIFTLPLTKSDFYIYLFVFYAVIIQSFFFPSFILSSFFCSLRLLYSIKKRNNWSKFFFYLSRFLFFFSLSFLTHSSCAVHGTAYLSIHKILLTDLNLTRE